MRPKDVPEINAQDLNKMGFDPLSFLSLMLHLVFHLPSLLHWSYKFMKKLIVKVVDQLSENYKQFILRRSLYVKLQYRLKNDVFILSI